MFFDSDQLIALEHAERMDLRTRAHDTWLLWDDGFAPAMQPLVVWLGEALRTHGLRPRIVCLSVPPPLLQTTAAACNVPLVAAESSFKALRRVASKDRPDLIHTFGLKAALLGRLIGLALDIPVVSTLQPTPAGQDGRRFSELADRLTLRLSRGLIGLRGTQRRDWPERARVIERFAPLSPRPAVLPKTIAFLSETSQKEQGQILYRLANMLPPMQFAIQCADPSRRGCLAEGVTNCRILPGGSVIPWKDFGLLCITGQDEWDLQRALEAMAHGVPVITFAAGPWRDIIEDGVNGWLVPPGNLASLARRLDKWDTLPEEDRRSLSDGARQTVASRFSPQAAASEVLEVYAQATRTGAGHR